jgi:hypothetical protein
MLTYVRRTNTWRMRMSGGLLVGGEDITAPVRAALEGL